MRAFVKQQVDYILGKNSKNFSFMVGFGPNFPRRPHHAGASCPVNIQQKCDSSYFYRDAPNPIVLHGAIVGGPDQNDNFNDQRDDYVQNEVSLNYNAGVQGLIASLCRPGYH